MPVTVTAFINAPERAIKVIYILPEDTQAGRADQAPLSWVEKKYLGSARDYTVNLGLRLKSVNPLGTEGGGAG